MAEVKVRIKYLSALRDKTHKRLDELTLPAGSRLTDVAAWLARSYGLAVPGPQLLSTLNGRGWAQLPDNLATELADGDEIAIFPLVSGG
jgi:molybdopterin converting factor small subunit